MIMKYSFFVLLILLAGAVKTYAQYDSWQTYGYIKYLFSDSENKLLSKNDLIDHQFHIRVNNRWYANNNLTAGLELRLRSFNGSSVETVPGFKSTVISPYPYEDLDVTFWNKQNAFAYGQIDRLFLDYNIDALQFTVGRQRIAWGTSYVWNITDLFNPQSILDFDYEEKPGSDALRVQYYTGAIGRLEMVLKPSPDKYERSAAMLWLFNKWDYDFYLIAAWHRNKPLAAAAFSGDIKGAGFRGEFKITGDVTNDQLKNTLLPEALGGNFSQEHSTNISFVLSLDYTFASSLYLHSEVLYNSIGKTKFANQFQALALNAQAGQADLLSPARISLFYETSYDLHPLVRGSIFTIYNPYDKSYILVPSISWSVITNLDLYLTGFLTQGANSSEFGNYGNTFFLRTKYSF
jgi:hypothetical protein